MPDQPEDSVASSDDRIQPVVEPPENLTAMFIDRLQGQIGALTGQLVARDLQIELQGGEIIKLRSMLEQAASPKGRSK